MSKIRERLEKIDKVWERCEKMHKYESKTLLFFVNNPK